MAKKKGKVIQMLSPENYIKQKARSLPIHECLITSDWKETKKVSIVVTRRHTNGNFTFCAYLVDLLCLGIKDAWYCFNQSPVEYAEFRDKYFENSEGLAQTTDYNLVHNIIYAAWEFAEDNGFQPCDDFIKTAQYGLEDDSDAIEIVEIECGENGKPMYIPAEFDTPFEIAKTLAALDKNVGKGNYEFILPFDNDEDDIDPFDEDEIDEEFLDDLASLLNEEDIDLEPNDFDVDFIRFIELAESETLTEDDESEMLDMLYPIAYNLLGDDSFAHYYADFCEEGEEYEIIEDRVLNEVVGVTNIFHPNLAEIKEKLQEILNGNENTVNLDYFYKISKGLPCYYLIKRHLSETFESTKQYNEELISNFPDYSISKLLATENESAEDYNSEKYKAIFNIDSFFPDRKTIHSIEFEYFFLTIVLACAKEGNLARLLAVQEHLDDFVLSPTLYYELESLIANVLKYFVLTILKSADINKPN